MISRMPASAAPTMGDRRSELSRTSPPFNTEMTDSRFTQSPALRYITRSEPGRYWRVQYARGFPKPIQVYFGDATYGGRDAALVEAQKFRDQIVARHQPHLLTEQRRNLKHKDKTAPYIGITLHADRRKGRGVYFSWRAAYMEGAHQRSRSWSVLTHGYEEAFRLASEFRHKMTGQPVGDCPPPPPELMAWLKNP